MAESTNQDRYNKKLAELQAYVPFLEKTIGYLKRTKQKSREVQLTKMESLYSMITDENKKWKYNILVKCEEVLEKLQGRMKLDTSPGSSQQMSEEDKEDAIKKDSKPKEFDLKDIGNTSANENMDTANENNLQTKVYKYENNFRKDCFESSNKESAESQNLKGNYVDIVNVADNPVRGRANEFPARRPFKKKFPYDRKHRRFPFGKAPKQKAILPLLLNAMHGNSSNFHFQDDQVDYARFSRYSSHQPDDGLYDRYGDNIRPGCSRFSPPPLLGPNQNYSANKEEWFEDLERLNFFNCNEERQFCEADNNVRRGNDRRGDQSFPRFAKQYQNQGKFFRNISNTESYRKYNFKGAFGNSSVGGRRNLDNSGSFNSDVKPENSPKYNEDFRKVEHTKSSGNEGGNSQDEQCDRPDQKKMTAGDSSHQPPTKPETVEKPKESEKNESKFSKQNEEKEILEDETIARTKYDKIYSNIGSNYRPSVESLYFESATRKNFKIPKKKNHVGTKTQETQENVSLGKRPTDEDAKVLNKMETCSKKSNCDSGETRNESTKKKKKVVKVIEDTDDETNAEKIKTEELDKKSTEKQKFVVKNVAKESDKESVIKRRKSISSEEKQKKLKLDEETIGKISPSCSKSDTQKTVSKEKTSTIVNVNENDGAKKDDMETKETDGEKQEAKQAILNEATKNNLHESNSADVLEFILKNYKHIKRIFESDSSDEEGKIKKKKKKKKKRYSSSSSSSSSDDEDSKSKKKKEIADSKEDEAKNKSCAQTQDDPKLTKREAIKRKTSSEQKPRKNELDFLHQDINEMWMCRDIITATGKRSCTVGKEFPPAKPKDEIDIRGLMENASRLRVIVERADFSHLLGQKDAQEVPGNPAKIDKKKTDEETVFRPTKSFGEDASELPPSPAKMVKKTNGREMTFRPTKPTVLKEITPDQHHDKNYFIRSKRTDCKLCSYNGKFITFHYRTRHADQEVLISRIDPLITDRLIEDSKRNDYESMVLKGDSKEKYTYICAFCPSNMIVDYTCHFYNHITTHTGEYRYFCGECDYSASTSQSLNAHLSKHIKKIKLKPKPAPPNSSYVFGYVCRECHYVQTLKDNMLKHVQNYHDNKSEIFRINLNLLTLDSGDKDARDEGDKSDVAINNFLKVKIEERDHAEDEQIDVETVDVARKSTETNLTAFVCEIDIEDKKIEKKRLEKMKEILENVNVPRTSIADRLKNKLGSCETETDGGSVNNEATVLQNKKTKPSRAFVVEPNAPKNAITSKSILKPKILNKASPLNVSPPLAETSNVGAPAKQVSQLGEDASKATPSETVTKKKSVPIFNIINRLQDNLNPTSASPKEDSAQNLALVETTPKANSLVNAAPRFVKSVGTVQLPMKTYQLSAKKAAITKKTNPLLPVNISQDVASTSRISQETNDGHLPPLSHYKTLATKEKPEVIFHAGPIKILKRKNGTILYACFVSHCVFCTDKPAVFESHCKLTHSNTAYNTWHCSGCNVKFTQKGISPTLHDIYLHLQDVHLRFFKKDVNFEFVRKAERSEGVVESSSQIQNQADSNLILENNTNSKYQFVITSVKSLSKESQNVTETILPDVSSSKSEGSSRESFTSSSQSSDLQPTSSSQKNPGTIRPVPISKLMAPEDTEDETNAFNSGFKGAPGVIDVETFGHNLPANCSNTKKLLTMDPAKIAHFYKCPVHSCKFSSFGRGDFAEHLSTHPDGVIFCLYCTNMLTISSYTSHLESVHANSRYACSHCFYRATNATFVKAHIDMNHRDVNKVMIVATPTETLPRKTADVEQYLSIRSIVKPYVCGEPNCKMETLYSNLFLEHYYVIHSRYKNMVCGYCDENLSKGILPHYWARHEIYPFHCRYCLSGSENLRTVIEHQATYHCHLPFCLISRKLRLTAKRKLTETTDEYDKIVYLYEKSVTPKYKNSNTKIIERYVMNFTENDITDKLIDIINSQPKASPTDIEIVNVDERVIVTEVGTASAQGESDPLSLNDAETTDQNLDAERDTNSPENVLRTRRTSKRFSCSLCNCKYTVKASAEEHMKKVHKISETTFVPTQPLNATNLEDCELTIVSKEPTHDSNLNRSSDGTVYPFCKTCGILRSKGKCNHLEVVDKEYRSGNQLITARLVTSHVICNEGTKTVKKHKIIADAIVIPQFIISGTKHTKSRYMCGGAKCQKFCRDENTFKSHLLKTHFQESNYICYHCGVDITFQPQTINIDLIVQHFQLHGPYLYRCSYCYFLGYTKEMTKRHIVEIHPTLPMEIKVYRKGGMNVSENDEKSKSPSPMLQVRNTGVTNRVLNKFCPPDVSKLTSSESASNAKQSAEELTGSIVSANSEDDSDNIEKSTLLTQSQQLRELVKRSYSIRIKQVTAESGKSEKCTNTVEYGPETAADAVVPSNSGDESDKSIEKSRSQSPLLQVSKTVVTYGSLRKSPSTDFIKSTNEIASDIDHNGETVAIFHSEDESNNPIGTNDFETNNSELFSQCESSVDENDVGKVSLLEDVLSESKISVDSPPTVKEVVRTYPAPKKKLKNVLSKPSEIETIVIDDNDAFANELPKENHGQNDSSLCRNLETAYSEGGFILPDGPYAQPSLDGYKCPHCYCAIAFAVDFFHHLEKNEKFLKEHYLHPTATHKDVNQWIYSLIIFQTRILNFWKDTNTDVERLCRFCSLAYNKPSSKHEDKHFDQKPFTCYYCKFSSTYKKVMDLHVQNRHKDRSLLCKVNKANAYPIKSLVKLNLSELFLMDIMTQSDFEHVEDAPVAKAEPKINLCFFCDFVGDYAEQCEHYKKRHPKKDVLGFIFKCVECNNVLFETRRLFVTHNKACHGGTAKMLAYFTGTYKYRCEICSRTVTDRRLYKLHVTTHFKMYKCKYCTYSTYTLRCLRKHYSDYHDDMVFEYFYDFIAEYKLNKALQG